MAKEKKHITVMRYFLPLLFLFYFGGITLFSHSHVVNGVIIVHSHPYKGEHSHTASEAETILFLSALHTFGDLPSSVIPLLYLTLTGIILILSVNSNPIRKKYRVISLRAPPSLV